jgi:hypothetical protein
MPYAVEVDRNQGRYTVMNDYQTMILFKQQLKDTEHRRQQDEFKRAALAAHRHSNGLSLSWLKQILHQTHLPKITLARPLSATQQTAPCD